MPSTTLPSSEDKNLVRRAVPTSKIFTAAVARLFVAYPNPHSWTYSNIWGAAVFLKDKSKNDSFFIRVIDLENHGGVIWEQELYEGFQYTQERPFFHTFDTDECQAGLLFVDDSEAETFYNKIINRQTLVSKAPVMAASAKVPRPSVIGGSRTKKVKGKVDKNSIGLPSEFRHLGHIGYTPEQGFSVQNNSPEWNGIFEQLKALGISAEEINSNQDFIKDFVEQRGGPPASTPARPAGQTSPPSPPNAKKSAGGGRRPPPPPPPRRSARPSGNSSAPPPPPAPPSLPSRNPPLPNRSNASPALPSRPPAGGIPPPPPPPPGMGGPPPPPPPPSGGPGIANAVPAEVVSGGRADLMASIRGAGGIGTLRKTEGPREPSPLASAGYEAGGAAGAAAGAAGGGDLASSLAVALKQRANAMQSDDEEEEDNDDWED